MSLLFLVLSKKVSMRFIINNLEIQKASQPFFCMGDRVEVAELFQDVFLIQKNIELLFLIKEDAGEANLMPRSRIIRLGT